MPLNQLCSDPPSSSPIRPRRPLASPDATREIAKESSSAAAATRAVVSADTSGEPCSARETVATETPASRATSAMLAWLSVVGIGVLLPAGGVRSM